MNYFKIVSKFITSVFYGLVSVVKYFFIGLITIITIIPMYIFLGIKIILGKNKRKDTLHDNKKLSFAIFGFSMCVYFVCVFLISKWYVQGLKIEYLSQDIINSTEIIEKLEEEELKENDYSTDDNNTENNTDNGDTTSTPPTYYPNDYWDYLSVPFMNVNFDELLQKNSDTVGWIKVEGTKVNYPVVQTSDNDFYLKHAFNKSDNIGGWIFADYRANFKEFGKNTIIYGHNMNNKTMFGSIPSMLNSSYLDSNDNHYIKISTPSSNSVWKVFSVYVIEPEVYYLKTSFKVEPYDRFVNTLKGRSIYDFGVEVTADDKILTLSTCDDTGTKRVVVHAKMINIEYK